VLVPLAQAASSVDHWMEAVDAAGPATPLSDPSFEGTVFIPDDVVSAQHSCLVVWWHAVCCYTLCMCSVWRANKHAVSRIHILHRLCSHTGV
jgi:hypothetical protein